MRSLYKTTLATLGLASALLLLAGTAAAQGLSTVKFAGTFTLPFEAQWGGMTLPAGEYSLQYGTHVGYSLVEIQGTAKGSPHGLVPVQGRDSKSAPQNGLVCMRASNTYVVTTLALPGIETTLNFSAPRGVEILAQNNVSKATAQLARVRVPVHPSGK